MATANETATPITPPFPNEATTEAMRWRIKAEEYEQILEAGILPTNVRTELVEGAILTVSPIGPRHQGLLNRLVHHFSPLSSLAILSVQGPLRIDEHNEPRPDLMLLRPLEDFYTSAHPGPADVLLLVEVMDTSASAPYDRGVKLGLYALAQISEVWLIDLNAQRIEIHRQPSQGLYTEISIRTRGQHVSPGAFADLDLEVNALLAGID